MKVLKKLGKVKVGAGNEKVGVKDEDEEGGGLAGRGPLLKRLFPVLEKALYYT